MMADSTSPSLRATIGTKQSGATRRTSRGRRIWRKAGVDPSCQRWPRRRPDADPFVATVPFLVWDYNDNDDENE